MKLIGIQGGKGSFSEEAALRFVKKHNFNSFEILYLISSERVLEALDQQKIDFGIIAIENAQGGVVIESIKALAKYCCQIEEMFHILVRQNLLSLPSVALDEISEIHSHEQAIKQCRNYLATNFWGIPLIQADDTAESARRLSVGELPKTAAVIANINCANLYGLKVLEADIHDLKNNFTLFLALKPTDNRSSR